LFTVLIPKPLSTIAAALASSSSPKTTSPAFLAGRRIDAAKRCRSVRRCKSAADVNLIYLFHPESFLLAQS